MKKCMVSLALALTFLLSPNKSEAFINFGFEMGDLTGWNIAGQGVAQVVESHHSPGLWDTTYYAQEGQKFLSLKVTGDYVKVWRWFHLEANERLYGMAAFDLHDFYNDFAAVKIRRANGSLLNVPFFESRNTLGFPYMDGPWTSWDWEAPYSGWFKLEYYVENAWNNCGDSYGLFDAYVYHAPVPEPATMVLLGSGLLGLLGSGVRKKKGTDKR